MPGPRVRATPPAPSCAWLLGRARSPAGAPSAKGSMLRGLTRRMPRGPSACGVGRALRTGKPCACAPSGPCAAALRGRPSRPSPWRRCPRAPFAPIRRAPPPSRLRLRRPFARVRAGFAAALAVSPMRRAAGRAAFWRSTARSRVFAFLATVRSLMSLGKAAPFRKRRSAMPSCRLRRFLAKTSHDDIKYAYFSYQRRRRPARPQASRACPSGLSSRRRRPTFPGCSREPARRRMACLPC